MLRTALHTQFNRVQTFLAVVDFGSFTKAADFLGISKAMASQHVKALEQALGVTLLLRTTRAVALSETGQGFYDDFKVIVADVEGAFDTVMQRHNGVSGRLRISTTGEYGERFILPLIPVFAARYPGLSISYDIDSALNDLVAERLDLVVRLGTLVDSNLRSRQLAEYDILLVAAPDFLARHVITQPADLAHVPWIANSNLQSPTTWTLQSTAQTVSVSGRAAHQSNVSHAIRALACAALGVAVLPAWLVEHDLACGRLQRVLPDYRLPAQPVSVVYPNSSHVPYRTRLFIDFLSEHLQG
ncbi:LysR family transcriptional regulator [Pseudomonas xantholysinigenes]|uniref:LysR family transcriptional regulator n=1 Tax=Pseudomonas xantholysinigenes TaxID=2745490 RepID=A0A9E6Q073_9PSED|nr:LysR family transcriptional regulator [Pseudomonas xantholysinigenes]QXI40339.1 LysR family transcriptional regulator [Pseudomonas xantholysinigenes]